MAKDVFISYSHIDAETADAVCEKLEQNGIEDLGNDMDLEGMEKMLPWTFNRVG